MTQSNQAHQFIAGTAPNAVPMVLLHGSGGDERDLMPFAGKLAPGAPLLALRGAVEIDGGFAFFHRRPDRSIDEADLTARIPALADLIAAVRSQAAFSKLPIAVG